MKIVPLSEGSFTVDASKQFVPFTVGADDLLERSRGSLLVEIQPFAIITQQDIIILDTGLGMLDKQGQFPLYKNLKENGIAPDDVTKVIMSHLHKDHTGGLLNPFTYQLSFEQADYFVHGKELDEALQVGAPSYTIDSLDVLKNSDQLRLLHNEEGCIDHYIRYQLTGAHSQYHIVIWVEEKDTLAFFGGDDASQLRQMKKRFAAKYDYDGKKADSLREKWWEQSRTENWSLLFYHDVQSPVYSHT